MTSDAPPDAPTPAPAAAADKKWAKAHEAAKENEAEWQLGEEMLKDPEDRRVPVRVGTATFVTRWPGNSALRDLMALEGAVKGMHTLGEKEFDELLSALHETVTRLLWHPERHEQQLTGDYSFEFCTRVVTGLLSAYGQGTKAVATFRR